MSVRTFAAIIGIAFLAGGLLGFVPAFLEPLPVGAPPLRVAAYYGFLFGLFPVNFMHNLVNLAIGAWGVAASRSTGGASAFSKSVAVIFFIFAVMGLMPQANTAFGLVPLYGLNVWVHAGTAFLAVIFGWLMPNSDSARRVPA